LTFDRDLYVKSSGNDELRILPSGDLLTSFTYTSGAGASLTAAGYDSTTHEVSFTIAGGPAEGDTIIWNNHSGGTDRNQLYSEADKAYQPVQAIFRNGSWVYDDAAKVTANIKGHVYNSNGDYKQIELINVELNMEAAVGEAIFTIPSSAFNRADGSADPNFPDDLVLWNNGTAALEGIDSVNPQIAVGDKAVVATTALGDGISSQRVDIGCTYEDQYGRSLGEKTRSFVFTANYFDYNTREMKFFTLDQQNGLAYDGTLEITSHALANSDNTQPITSFAYSAGLFDYVDSLVSKISIGKLPQVGNELAGIDVRLQELLMFRSTIGARVNRLELQTNRLTKTEESLSSLLSANEDADLAEVIMDLQLQENVYQSCLSAGARIIQPSLVDFLR